MATKGGKLAERPLLGFPGLSVELHHTPKSDRSSVVLVREGAEPIVLDNLTRSEAADRYFHPFCYGLEPEGTWN